MKKQRSSGGGSRQPDERKGRRGFDVLPGRRAVETVLRFRPERIERVVVARGTRLGSELADLLEVSGVPLDYDEREELDRLASGVQHQGVAAVLAEKSADTLDQILGRRESKKNGACLLVLDGVHDPHNLGAVLRAAETAGALGIVYTVDRSAPLSPAARKVSVGASELLPAVPVVNLQRALEQIKAAGWWVIGTSGEPGIPSLFESELPEPMALVLGGEERGIRKLTRKLCDVVVRLPMEGRIESLNVSQAAAVCMFEVLRRRLAAMGK